MQRSLLTVVAIIAILVLSIHTSSAIAQDGTVRWTEAKPLLYMPRGDNGTIPYIFTGPSNNTHLLFFGRPENDDIGAFSLYYSRWQDGDWLPIKDVLINPDGGMPDRVVGVEDNLGYLHVFWVGSRVWYSRVHGSEAGDARSWMQPIAVFDQSQALSTAAAIGSDNTLYLLVTTSDRAVYALSISTDGQSTTPVLIYQATTHYPYYPTLIVTNSGKLIGCWNDTNGEDSRARGVVCTNSDDRGASWSLPEDIAVGHYWGGVFYFPAADRLARIIGGGNGVGGRTIELSEDDGVTWTPPTDLTQGVDMAGYNNHLPTMDSAGTTHVLVNPGDARHVHSSLRGNVWSPNIPAGWAANDWIGLATAQGNRLVVAWWLDNTIFTATGTVDAPLAESQPFPPPSSPANISSTTETTTMGEQRANTVAESSGNGEPPVLASLSFIQSLGSMTILAISVAPALLLVLTVIGVRMVRLRR
jgi:hypothetical protein